MAIIVSDTSPVRAFAHLQRFDLLERLFGEILIPPAVVSELERPTSKLLPLTVIGVSPFRVQAATDLATVARFRLKLDPGESEALALARELNATVLIDEAIGRSVAAREGLRTIGTLGTILLAKEQNFISAVRPLMEQLRDETNFRVTATFFAAMLRRAGE